MTVTTCCAQNRRELIRAGGVSNGIDYLEVLDGPDVPEPDRQRVLEVHLLDTPSAELLALPPDGVVISGGVRIVGVRTTEVSWSGQVLTARVDRAGDFSTYTLALRTSSGGVVPGMDERLSQIDFSFKVDCPAEFDCARCAPSRPEPQPAPDLDYLTRDYAGFRRLMLDRLSVLAPDLRERNAADLAPVLVEALAYTADHQSYRLDAVGMEASLTTARRRTSARRHARLVDHRTDDGSNARAWVQVRAATGEAGVPVPAGTPLLTRVPWLAPTIDPASADYQRALSEGPVVFETMEEVQVSEACNAIGLYAWGDEECSLPVGATAATLAGHPPLVVGDVVVLLERLGPRSGAEADADPQHRHAVRLTGVAATQDPIGGRFLDPPTADPVDVTEITWPPEDAVPFAVCLSTRTATGLVTDVSVVLGNILLADHGRTLTAPGAATVPEPDPRLAYPPSGGTQCSPGQNLSRPARFTLTVPGPDLTMVGTIGHAAAGQDPRVHGRFDRSAPAASATRYERRHVLPDVTLTDQDGRTWLPVRDLLASNAFAPDFVVEVEADATAACRFGSDGYGLRPRAGTVFDIRWRQGNGPGGNIGSDALAHVVTADARIASASNPLPGNGGRPPDRIDRTRQDAPAEFLVPQRAVTPDDYAAVAGRHPQVQRAVATQRWTGSWYTVFLTVDRVGGLPVDAEFEADLRAFLETYRMAGHDLEVDGPHYVPLEVVLRVCVLPDYYRTDVAQAVLDRLGRGRLPDGRPAFFHPDAWTFGLPVALSALLAAAQEVDGVHYVEPITFQRRGDDRSDAVSAGEITIGRLEIARLDNDPSFVDHGTMRLEPEGGR
jgi:hypothetical protein